MQRILNIVCALLFALSVWGQNEATAHAVDSLSVAERNAQMGFNDTIDRWADDFVQASLVVTDPGAVLYSTLGHAAIHLQCPTFDLDYIFSYESENIRQKFLVYLQGGLKMGMFAMTVDDFLEDYRDQSRGVREYTLNLSPEQKQQLWRIADKHVAEGANLPYDYFHRGCAKSVVHVMHEVLGENAIHYAAWSEKYTKQTQRELVRNFITQNPWEEFIMYFLVGIEGDEDCPYEQKLIIPSDLVEVWQKATLENGTPLLSSEEHTLLEPTKQTKATWCTPLLISILLLLLALLSLLPVWIEDKTIRIAGNIVDYMILGVQTLLGLMMTYLICFSSLPCTNWNWLIIPFNILPAIGWYWRKYWALPYAVVILLWCVAMILAPHILVDWPHILLAITFAIVLAKTGIVQIRLTRD